jgi:predicted CXXCH cytochrome family protein
MDFRVQLPGQPALTFPAETMIGGTRHGISFLLRIHELEGSPLPRDILVEARYFHSAGQDRLAHSLGFPEDKPTTYETAMGRVLTPFLEKRCLSCHVGPRAHGGTVETGVSCENCHGPGLPHLQSLRTRSSSPGKVTDLGILNPKKLPVADKMRPCSQCHAGSSYVEDPLPDDLLISDQVTALKNSECWRQGGGQITCVNCHNPHQDAPRSVLVARAERTCLGCHSAQVKEHAALCPVSRASGCVNCHMPNQIRGAFSIADHWIRVDPKQNVKVPAENAAWRTTITPKHMYLRMIELEDKDTALQLRQRIVAGAPFFDLARANSIDRTSAMNGGYLGDIETAQMDPAWSATAIKLQPGELSEVAGLDGKYFILQRLSRNFREEAEDKFNDALRLRKEGKEQAAIATLIDSLKIYPRLLRALTFLGVMYSESGNPQVGTGVLHLATALYPQDAGAHFNLGIAYGAMRNEQEINEYKRTIEIDGDYVPAYLNWGGALVSKGQLQEAIEIYRRGINVNPLNAQLHYSLSVVLDQVNEKQEAAAERALAAKIDAKYASR